MTVVRIGSIQRRAHLPCGCDITATSDNPQVLMEAIYSGNRATRREALRKTVKLAKAWQKREDARGFK